MFLKMNNEGLLMNSFELNIGNKIKELRIYKGYSQETLAHLTDLTRSYLSLLENGKKMPTISTLAKIAETLDVEIGEFFITEAPGSELIISKKDKRKQILTSSFGLRHTELAMKMKNKLMEPFLIRIDPKAKGTPKRRGKFAHKSEEFIFVLEGTLKFVFGDKEYSLDSGDSAYFNSNITHWVEASGDHSVVFLSIHA